MAHSSSSRRKFHWIVVALPLALLLFTGLVLLWQGKQQASSKEGAEGVRRSDGVSKSVRRSGKETAAEEARQMKVNEDFHVWVEQQRAHVLNPTGRPPEIAAGVAMAEARQARMKRLIRENPRQAIAEALSFEQWAALPKEIQALVEKPFSVVADYEYYPVCVPPGEQRPEGAAEYVAKLSMSDGSSLEAFVYGQQRGLMSKKNLPVQGIALDGAAAVRDGVFQTVSVGELALFTPGQPVVATSLVTGQPVGGGAVNAVAGGKTFVFADSAELEQFAAEIARLDAMPGKVAASSVLALPYGTGGSGEFDLNAVQSFAMEQASAWTETKKKLYLIRVNFTDNTAVPVTQAAATTEINGASSDMIRAMSYGKTWVEGTVSANVYTLPQASTYYANGGNGLNSDLLRDARNVFRNTKSGGDAAINIGPVSATGNGDSGGIGDYDIVGIFFSSIGMVSGGVSYAGLAGGGNLWVQNANYTSLYTHEWGHNYGLGHASFWQTSDGSVTGTGSSVEYGDDYDVMGGGPAPQGHYHPMGKSLLNWLTTSEWTDATVSGSNTYRIYREDDAATTGTPRGVRVTKVATPGSQEYYWIGYKPAFTSNAHLQRGAYLNWQMAGQTRCWLLDTTPNSSAGKTDAAVDLGRTYADATAGVYITPVAVGGTGAQSYLDVRVNVGTFPGNAAPTAAGGISGPSTLAARSSATFSVTGNDSNGDTLAYFWDANDGTVNNNAASLTHTWTVGGSYTLSATVSDMKGGKVTVTKTVTVTDPLDTWTSNSIGTTDYLQDVVWGKGRFVSAEYWGGVYASWDGNAWTKSFDPPAFDNQPRLAFGGNVFVMAGKIDNAAAAQICWSADGRIWNQATFPNGVPQIYEVTYGNGVFLAVADGGTVLRSADGKTWTLTSVSGSPNFRHIAWDGSTWVAVAMNDAQARPEVVWTSLDGQSWTQRSALGADIYRVYGAGGVMYACGWYAGVMHSTDHGVSWQNAALPAGTRWTTYRMAISESGTFFATAKAMDESGSPYALLVSTDGINWTRTTVNSGNTVVGNANALVYGFGKFLTVENNGVTRSSNGLYANAAPVPAFISNPATGAARQLISFRASATDADSDPLVYAWDLGSQSAILDGASITPTFAFGGSYTVTLRVSDGHGGLSTLTQTINVSDPARSFTQRTSGTTNGLNAIATNGTTVVAAGDGGVIRTSTDGVTWTTRTVTEFASNIYFRAATWDGSKFILVGEDYNSTVSGWVALVYTSADGVTWTRRYRGSVVSSQLYGVAASGSGVVAVGNSGTVLGSTNGTSWSSVAVSGITTSQTLGGVAWNGSVYVFTGYTGSNGGVKVFSSSDGANWIDRSTGTGVASWQDLRGIAWLQDRFVSSGWYSGLRTSTNGGQTFSTTRSHREENPAMAYGDGLYFTAGVDHDASDADGDVLSVDGNTWYSFAAPTTADRKGAVFFKHTFITVGAGGSIWQSADTTPGATFASWQSTQFPGGGASSLATADADADGVANLIEYALNRNPNAATGANGAGGTSSVVIAASRAWLHLDVPEPGMSDVIYTVQGSSTLGGGWTDLAQKVGAGGWVWLGGGTAHVSQGSLSGGRLPTEIGMPDSANGQARYFLRLQVGAP